MPLTSRIRAEETGMAMVSSFIYEPGNGTRFDITLTQLSDLEFLLSVTNVNQCMIVSRRFPASASYIAGKIPYFSGSDYDELANLIKRVLDGEFLG